jgi:hypothetical protein
MMFYKKLPISKRWWSENKDVGGFAIFKSKIHHCNVREIVSDLITIMLSKKEQQGFADVEYEITWLIKYEENRPVFLMESIKMLKGENESRPSEGLMVLKGFESPRVNDALLKEYEHGHSKHFAEKQLILNTIKQLTEEGIVPTRRSICDRSGIDIGRVSNLLQSLRHKGFLDSQTTHGGRRVGRMVESFTIRKSKDESR